MAKGYHDTAALRAAEKKLSEPSRYGAAIKKSLVEYPQRYWISTRNIRVRIEI
jgi:hypothetical protein